MPRGFLIKRKKHDASTWFNRRGSAESELNSESGSSDHKEPNSQSSECALNLSIKNNCVFKTGLDLTTNNSDNESHSPLTSASNSGEVNFNKIYMEATRKAQILVDQEKRNIFEFNNNSIPSIRHPLADFNRESYHQFLQNAVPLSVSTGSSLSPFYQAAYDHLNGMSTASSPNGSSSTHGSSPRSLAPPPPPMYSLHGSIQSSMQQQQSPPSPKSTTTTSSSSKKRPHPTANKTSQKNNKKVKAVRKIEFNDSSPVSGTYIREETDDGIRVVSGDIDTNLNIVEVTPEAEEEIAKIDNKIGDYRCRLCKEMYDNAFGLAQHRCSRIVHVEYRCPECDKVFNCSANLASHRRWHKPRQAPNPQTKPSLPKLLPNGLTPEAVDSKDISLGSADQGQFPCSQCGKIFKRQAYLRKHMATHTAPQQLSKFPCHLCGVALGSESERASHIVQHSSPVPSDSRLHMCTMCGTSVPDRLALDEHVRRHHGEVFPCKLCPNTFYSLPGLSRHITKCHSVLADNPDSHRPPVVMLQIPTLSRPC